MNPLAAAKRLIIKIGSALLVDDAGAIRRDWLAALAADVARLRADGRQVLIVSSGSIAVGRWRLGLTGARPSLAEKQAAAATGQIELAHAYQTALAAHNITVAQVLLTGEDTEDRRRHLNARATLDTLLDQGAVPVINENDTVATAEIRFGDNDRLAARVAQMISADTLVLLSDIDGLYTADPRKDPAAQHIPTVARITKAIADMAGEPPPGYSSGGMVTKIKAARIAMDAGCRMAIALGKPHGPLGALLSGAGRATWFEPTRSPLSARKAWIAGTLSLSGTLIIDPGAITALHAGKSLLAAGLTAVDGPFHRGDPVLIVGPDGARLGCGLSGYDSAEMALIVGVRSQEIAARLGHASRGPVVHRDDLVLDG